jgi:hypothetical protein
VEHQRRQTVSLQSMRHLRNALGERLSGTESAELRALGKSLKAKKRRAIFRYVVKSRWVTAALIRLFLVYIVNMEKVLCAGYLPNARKLCTLVKNGDV